MSPIKYFLIPLAALGAIAFLVAVNYGSEYAWLVVIPFVGIAAVLSLKPQLEWWYWNKFGTPDLPTAFAPIMDRFSLYRGLDLEGKREFRRRTFLLREKMQFLAKGMEKVTKDIEYMVAASAATVSFYREDPIYPDLDTVVFYPHQFPSPKHEVLHSSELYVPDGTFVFTLNFFVRSVMEPEQYLQLGIYEFAKAYQLVYPGRRFPVINWQQIEAISQFNQAKVEEFIGLEDLDLAAIGTCLYFTHPERFRSLYPSLYESFDSSIRPMDY